MVRVHRVAVTIALLVIASVALAACGGGDDGGGGGDGETAASGGGDTPVIAACSGVIVTLSNFQIDLDASSVAAGDVTFCVDNLGPTTHEFKVVRSELEINKLPMAQPLNAAIDESLVDELEVVGKVAPMRTTDDVQSLTVSLEAGTYYLLCNVPSHYQLGMRTAFTVE